MVSLTELIIVFSPPKVVEAVYSLLYRVLA